MEKKSQWLVAGTAFVSAYWFMVRPWHLRWGATDDEVTRVMRGDERVANPDFHSTRAITIEASPRTVWSKLKQKSLLEPAKGLSTTERSTELFVEEYRSWVQTFVSGIPGGAAWSEGIHSVELSPLEARKTRVISRVRARAHRSPSRVLLSPFEDVAKELQGFFEERKWLLEIKREAELLAQRRNLKLMTNPS